jgi:ATP-dependent RNA helicase DeaD
MRVVVETLAGEFDVMEIALAATALAHEALSGGDSEDEVEIPQPRVERRPERGERPERPGRRERKAPRPGGEGMTRVFIGAGAGAGLRPQDLVGAITGETPLTGRDIGAIQISDRFSLVEVPDGQVDTVIAGLRGTHLKGKRPTIRRERF